MRFRETGHFAKAFREASGAGVVRMRRKIASRAPKLTQAQIHALQEGARHPDGVINPSKKSNFDKPERRMEKLVMLGFAIPNPHGDWYITEAGRDIVDRSSQ